MADFLINKLFKNNSGSANSSETRKKIITFSGIAGILCNIFLFILKLIIGFLSGSVSILADAFNNMSDIGSSAVTIIGYKLSEKPADKEHPYGHGRLEYTSAMIVAFLILFMGIELFKTSVLKVLHPEPLDVKIATIAILVISIIIKFCMYLYNRKVGAYINSAALIATARDSINDAFSTSAVLISILVFFVFKINIDAYIGIIVAGFIVYSGIKTLKEALNPLLGMPASEEQINSVKKIVLEYSEFMGMHDLIFHNYGPGRIFVSFHVEVPYDTDILSCHEKIDSCERQIYESLGMEAIIHMDPVVYDDKRINTIKVAVAAEIQKIDSRISIHDFRVIEKPQKTSLLFDVKVPYDILKKQSEKQLKNTICEKCKEIDEKYETIVNIDIDF